MTPEEKQREIERIEKSLNEYLIKVTKGGGGQEAG